MFQISYKSIFLILISFIFINKLFANELIPINYIPLAYSYQVDEFEDLNRKLKNLSNKSRNEDKIDKEDMEDKINNKVHYEKPTLQIPIQWNMSAYIFGDDVSIGGYIGLKSGFKTIFPLNRNINLWTYFWLGSTMRYSASSKDDLSSNGRSTKSSLFEYLFNLGITFDKFKVFSGMRGFKGIEKSSYDWWSDYTSDIAWDGSYADYESNSRYSINVTGYLLGVGYVFPIHKRNVDKLHFLELYTSILFIDLTDKYEQFYYLELEYTPKKSGLICFFTFGISSINNLFELGFGVGYQFSPSPKPNRRY